LVARGIAVRTRIRALLWAAAPVLIWTAFSLLYYGFPFPNTAYAKLGTGIAEHALWRQGLHYFGNMLSSNTFAASQLGSHIKLQPLGRALSDPLTLAVSVSALLLAPWVRRWGWAWALGVALYLVYVASIGGDFMAGRFFTAPMLAGAIALARARLPLSRTARLLTLGLLTLAVPALAWPNIRVAFSTAIEKRVPASDVFDTHLIADERSYYFADFALATITAPNLALFRPNNYRARAATNATSIVCGGLGYSSIRGGPGVHLIDTCALADPLLAHLPIPRNRPSMRQTAPPSKPTWRIGHFERAIPAGYQESLEQDANLLIDPALHACYERIRRITRAPLLDGERLRDIVRVNLIGTGCRAS
jgi:arabinofuranosyltransferase